MDNNILVNIALILNLLRFFLVVCILIIIAIKFKKNYKKYNNLRADIIIKNVIRYFFLVIIYLSISTLLHNSIGEEGDIISFLILVWILIEIYKDYLKNRKSIIIDELDNKEILEQKCDNKITNQECSIDKYNITKKSKIRPYIEYITQNMNITTIELNHNNKLKKINVQDLIDMDKLKINSCTIQGNLLNEYGIELVITIDYNKYLLTIKYNVGDKGIVRKFVLDLDSELVENYENR